MRWILVAPTVDNGHMAKLSDDQIEAGLQGLPEWRREGDEIVRDYDCGTFPAAIQLVNQIADYAEAANHHPDIDIRWKNVRIALTTHDDGGLSQRDLDLAAQIEAAAPEAG